MKFKKGLSAFYVLLPIVMLSIAIPAFYLSFVTQDANNTKKALQEAAYTGALAGASAIDVKSFQTGKEVDLNTGIQYGDTAVGTYPEDTKTGNPVSFVKENDKYVRYGKGNITLDATLTSRDCIGSAAPIIDYDGDSATNIAATEAVKATEQYLKSVLNFVPDGVNTSPDGSTKRVYHDDDYMISVSFSRTDNIIDRGPYNKVNVTVWLKYKPAVYKKLFEDTAGNSDITIRGESSATTLTN